MVSWHRQGLERLLWFDLIGAEFPLPLVGVKVFLGSLKRCFVLLRRLLHLRKLGFIAGFEMPNVFVHECFVACYFLAFERNDLVSSR